MDEEPLPDETKLTRSKQHWASVRKFITGTPRHGDDRLPPGQHLVRDWPVLDLGRQPAVAVERWRLTVKGLVARPVTLDWAAFQALPQETRRTDIHCVTTWSRYDNEWAGVATQSLLDLVEPRDEAAFVMLHGYDGYTTNVPLADFAADDAVIAHGWQGKPLTREHGGPARLVIPHLYFWKSAKWISAIEFLGADRLGFWEVNGYHRRGDPWAEERYS
ncbi:sulfite oxidase-like oxidoreductase [Sphingomonas sp.]|jgi:DMSO/TMAO reductase YedYZ molybdopterin-dependent catalytic subunit|uniref:sulfite oxidase-like oxidoreductase n=1 Tax=Sphingomonas sp. TaxID=28214 RepID=UPI002619BEE9|nr:sulfite oxidase-like oxidoreductase [Sphingomonas sp.]MDF2495182.1 putative oxidoreductase [Sphingomonas sp.]